MDEQVELPPKHETNHICPSAIGEDREYENKEDKREGDEKTKR